MNSKEIVLFIKGNNTYPNWGELMATFKLTTWNIAWMNKWFEKDRAVYKSSAANEEIRQRVANVMNGLDADIIGIQEGPKHKKQMAKFCRDYLNDTYDIYNISAGTQNNFALVRKGFEVEVKQHRETHKIYEYLARGVQYFTWGEVKKETAKKIPRKPVVLALTPPGSDETVELMVFHTKSKISKLKNRSQWENRDMEAIVDALQSRQRLSGEMVAIRNYLTHAILSKRTKGCILIGDLNEGPNRDIFEEKFLITNIVDELRGGFHREEALMHHALTREWLDPDRAKAFTAEFRDATQEGKKVKVLLDHIMVSTSIKGRGAPIKLVKGSGRIEHELYEANVKNSGNKKNERPSDHRPVSAKFKY